MVALPRLPIPYIDTLGVLSSGDYRPSLAVHLFGRVTLRSEAGVAESSRVFSVIAGTASKGLRSFIAIWSHRAITPTRSSIKKKVTNQFVLRLDECALSFAVGSVGTHRGNVTPSGADCRAAREATYSPVPAADDSSEAKIRGEEVSRLRDALSGCNSGDGKVLQKRSRDYEAVRQKMDVEHAGLEQKIDERA